jgi:transglutaminase-like putative cysteine protease
LRPNDRPGLRVLSSTVRVSDGHVTASYVDGFGTNVDVVEVPEAHADIRYEMRASVETNAVEGVESSGPWELSVYRGDSSRVRRATVAGVGWDVEGSLASWSAIESMLAWLPQRFVYRLGHTEAETPLEEFVSTGTGVCQDFAHALIALLRAGGWAARYVSGYLFAGDHESGRIEAQAMHAWAEVHIPGNGWIGLDPTTGHLADERYVPVAAGRDYDDVRPVRGVLAGVSMQENEGSLEIIRAEQ